MTLALYAILLFAFLIVINAFVRQNKQQDGERWYLAITVLPYILVGVGLVLQQPLGYGVLIPILGALLLSGYLVVVGLIMIVIHLIKGDSVTRWFPRLALAAAPLLILLFKK